jgi:Sigma-70, region 4
MNRSGVGSVTIAVDDAHSVRGLLLAPPSARACYVLAHGAGAGMFHPFMDGAAKGLAERGIATLRYQFPYMERGAKRPDPPTLAHATVRAAVTRLAPALPLLAGGKSFGGRMTSQAQAASPLPGVRGLAFLGFPPEHGEVIDLVYYHGKSVREVAEIVGVAAATVKTRMFYARKKLAALVATA